MPGHSIGDLNEGHASRVKEARDQQAERCHDAVRREATGIALKRDIGASSVVDRVWQCGNRGRGRAVRVRGF